YAMKAAPGAVLDDLGLVRWRELREELGVIRKLRIAFFNQLQGIGQRHLAVAMMVSIALAVGCDVDKLRSLSFVEATEEALGKGFAAVQQAVEGDGPRDGSVVKEDGDGMTRAGLDQVRLGRVHACVLRLLPAIVVRGVRRGACLKSRCFD